MEAINIKDVDLDDTLRVDVYSELSRKQFNLIQEGFAYIEVPHGVSMKNRTGSKGLLFSCDGEGAAKILEEGLENSGMSWQEEFHEEVVS